jgi:hypothetical protein
MMDGDQTSTNDIQKAFEISKQLAKALGMENQFKSAFDEGVVPLADVEPLPLYNPTDPRTHHLEFMEQLRLYLSVIDGFLGAMQKASQQSSIPSSIIVRWSSQRSQAFIDIAKIHGVPIVLEGLMKKNSVILTELSATLRTCLFSSEKELANEAARYGVERNISCIVFLAICPNIPFILPTIEIRILFTKPLVGISEAAHQALGKIPIFGFAIWILYSLTRIFDSIPRAQVKVVQGFFIRRWLRNKQKRSEIILKYLDAIAYRVKNPRIDAFHRGLISLVS